MSQVPQLWVLFSSTSQAMEMEFHCENQGIVGRLLPLPSALEAGCHFAWKTEPDQEKFLTNWMTSQGISWEKILIHHYEQGE